MYAVHWELFIVGLIINIYFVCNHLKILSVILRFIRAQHQLEKISLVPMKYPRKKEKDAW